MYINLGSHERHSQLHPRTLLLQQSLILFLLLRCSITKTLESRHCAGCRTRLACGDEQPRRHVPAALDVNLIRRLVSQQAHCSARKISTRQHIRRHRRGAKRRTVQHELQRPVRAQQLLQSGKRRLAECTPWGTDTGP